MEESKEEDNITFEGIGFMGSDVVSQDFLQRVRKIQTYTESDGRRTIKQRVSDKFTATLIRVIGFKELYEAWESQCRSVVEGMKKESLELRRTMTYASDKDDTADMMQIDWIERVPKVLTLQMNRLNYSAAGLIKHKHRVTFDKQIFVDRFLLQNAEKSERISSEVRHMRDQIKDLEQSIEEFRKFGGSSYDICEMLEHVSTLFAD